MIFMFYPVSPLTMLQTIIMVSIVVAILTAPVNLLVDYLFVEILSAPTVDSIKNQIQNQNEIVENHKSSNLTKLMKNAGEKVRRTSTATVDAIKVARRRYLSQGNQESLQIPESTIIAQNHAMISSHDLVQEQMMKLERESSSREVNRSQVKVDQYQRKNKYKEGEDVLLTQLLSEFVVDLSEQRRVLKPSVRDRYDLQWG
jgi:hypothetical protein